MSMSLYPPCHSQSRLVVVLQCIHNSQWCFSFGSNITCIVPIHISMSQRWGGLSIMQELAYIFMNRIKFSNEWLKWFPFFEVWREYICHGKTSHPKWIWKRQKIKLIKKQTYNAKVSIFDLLMGATTWPLPCTHVAPLQAIPSSPTWISRCIPSTHVRGHLSCSLEAYVDLW